MNIVMSESVRVEQLQQAEQPPLLTSIERRIMFDWSEKEERVL